MQIVFVTNPTVCTVKLDGKTVGTIKVNKNGNGFCFVHKGSKERGEVFKTLEACKASLR